MADFAIDRINMVSNHFEDAMKMVVGFLGNGGFVSRPLHCLPSERGRRPQRGSHLGRSGAEIGRFIPERIPAIVAVQTTLHLPRDGLMLEPFGAALDLRLGQFHLAFFIPEVDVRDGRGRDEHLAPLQPASAVDDKPTHSPRGIVEQEVGGGSHSAVARLDREAF